jgi:hypothetical protein
MGTNYALTFPGASEPVHLGKMSAGWVFLFRARPEWTPEKAFINWVMLAEMGEIVDEYSRAVDLGQLLQDVVYSYMREGAQHHEAAPGFPVYTNHGFEFSTAYFC